MPRRGERPLLAAAASISPPSTEIASLVSRSYVASGPPRRGCARPPAGRLPGRPRRARGTRRGRARSGRDRRPGRPSPKPPAATGTPTTVAGTRIRRRRAPRARRSGQSSLGAVRAEAVLLLDLRDVAVGARESDREVVAEAKRRVGQPSRSTGETGRCPTEELSRDEAGRERRCDGRLLHRRSVASMPARNRSKLRKAMSWRVAPTKAGRRGSRR